ncbi:riboflavin kinase [Nannochloropsis oceanica]
MPSLWCRASRRRGRDRLYFRNLPLTPVALPRRLTSYLSLAAALAVLLTRRSSPLLAVHAWKGPPSHSAPLAFSCLQPRRGTCRPLSPGGRGNRWRLSGSLDGHKETIYGLHDSFETRPSSLLSSSLSSSRDVAAEEEKRAAHNEKQASVFDESARFFSGTEATPADVVPRLHTIVRAATLSPSSCVLDIGTGTGVLLPYFKEEGGVEEGQVVGVDVSSGMLAVARKRFPRAEFWEGDVLDFAEAWLKGRGANGELFDAVFFNACFGNVYDQERALREVGRVMGREGRVVISHPLGAAFVDELKRRSPSVVLKSLPKDEGEWKHLLRFTPLQLTSFLSTPSIYLALLHHRPHQALPRALLLQGPVSQGYGRGSKKLGIPTANLPSSLFIIKSYLDLLPTGVYCGWARVRAETYKAVVNVGYSPTFEGKENKEKIVEAHLIEGGFERDFYGEKMTLVLAGFQRPERKFRSFPALVEAINQDVQDAKNALEGLDSVYANARRLVDMEELEGEEGEGKARWVPFEEWSSGM